MYQLASCVYIYINKGKQTSVWRRLSLLVYGTCCALNKLLLLSRVKYHQIGFDIAAATQRGAIINKPCGVMASIYRHRSPMPSLNGSSGAAAAHIKLCWNRTTQTHRRLFACVLGKCTKQQSVRCQSNADYITLNQLGTRELSVDTRRILYTQRMYVHIYVRCGNMQNQCATYTSVLTGCCCIK